MIKLVSFLKNTIINEFKIEILTFIKKNLFNIFKECSEHTIRLTEKIIKNNY